MLGLIKKDFLLLKSNLTYFLVITMVYSLLVIEGSFEISFIMILPFMAVIMFLSTFSYDDYNKWNAYAITLPVVRKNIVKSKYIATLIIIVVSSLVGLLISYLISFLSNQSIDFGIVIEEIFGSLLGIILVISIMFPLIFKFGIEKARISIFVGVFGIAIVLGFLSSYIDFENLFSIVDLLDKLWFIVIPLVCGLFILISYFISVKIYLKKEF